MTNVRRLCFSTSALSRSISLAFRVASASCYAIAAEDAGTSDALQDDASMGVIINAIPLVSDGMFAQGIARISSNFA